MCVPLFKRYNVCAHFCQVCAPLVGHSQCTCVCVCVSVRMRISTVYIVYICTVRRGGRYKRDAATYQRYLILMPFAMVRVWLIYSADVTAINKGKGGQRARVV